MNNKKIHIKNLIVLIIVIILIAVGISITMSRYKSESESTLSADVAFYVVKDGYQTGNIFLENVYPRDEVYTYQFTVANFEGSNTAETSIDYTVDLDITTNLPLTYKIYRGSTQLTSSSDVSNQVVLDDTGATYMRKIQIKGNFAHGVKKTDTYKIEVTFPKSYAENEEFEGMIDNINIKLDAKQKID